MHFIFYLTDVSFMCLCDDPTCPAYNQISLIHVESLSVRDDTSLLAPLDVESMTQW